MLNLHDDSLLSDFEQEEAEDSAPSKRVDDVRTIYGSRGLGLWKDSSLLGGPVLCDFGEARLGRTHTGLIQPRQYRAAEVLFDMSWSTSVDIWSVACLVSIQAQCWYSSADVHLQAWNLAENRNLFDAVNEDNEPCANSHVAKMVAYMGLPSLEFLQRSELSKYVFDEQGQSLLDTCTCYRANIIEGIGIMRKSLCHSHLLKKVNAKWKAKARRSFLPS